MADGVVDNQPSRDVPDPTAQVGSGAPDSDQTTAAELAAQEAAHKAAKQARKAAKRARKRAKRRRRLTFLAVFWTLAAVLGAVAFTGVVTMYRTTTTQPPRPQLGTDVVAAYIEPVQVLPAEGRVAADLTITVPADLLVDGERLKQRLTITIIGFSGSQTVTFPADTPAGILNSPIRLRVDHDSYIRYPWDDYIASVWLLASTDSAEGARWYPIGVGIWGDMPGWHVSPDSVYSKISEPVPATTPYQEAVADVLLDVRRAGSTQATVVLLLVAMVALAVLGVAVAVAVSRRKRRIEATMASWFAAMLFALVPLRLNMPGSPPIGAWIDFLVFLWVVLALMLSLTVFVVSWLRWTPAPEPVKKKSRHKLHRKKPHKGGAASILVTSSPRDKSDAPLR